MSNHKSAMKAHRRQIARRDRNRHHRARLRSALKKLRTAVAGGDADAAKAMLPATLSLIDRSAKLGALHANAADRTKSRVTRAVNGVSAGA